MTPGFALSLSFDGIRLLQRASDGWRLVGDVPLETEDLPGALSVLLDTAHTLSPGGVTSKLVIPNAQIRYLTLDTGAVDEASRWVAARAALDGATPYPVSDLAFDLVAEGPRTHIAAVAQETLDEAEAFAAGYGFSPLSFVSTPDAGDFPGEPFFGATAWAKAELGPAAAITRDTAPIVVTGPAEMPAERAAPEAAPTEDISQPPANTEAEASLSADIAEIADEAPPQATPVEDTLPEPATEELTEAASNPDPVPGASQATSQPEIAPDDPASDPQDQEDAAPLPVLTFRSATRVRQPAPEAPDPEEAAQPQIGFTSRRTDPEASPALAGVTRAAPVASASSIDAPSLPQDALDDVNRAQPISEPAPDAAASLVPSPAFEAASAQATARLHAATLAAVRPSTEEAERLTVFGARQAAGEVGGKPRFLGAMLTVALVVFLAGVAAWSSVFSNNGIARFFSPDEAPALAADVPDGTISLPDPLPDDAPATPDPVTPDQVVASIDPALTDEDAAVLDALRDARPDPVEPAPIDPIAYYDKTGIWAVAPDVPRPAALVPLDSLYEPSVDRGAHQRESHDAVALPTWASLRTDTAPLPFSSPPPPRTAFRLDARGLVIPTPEGALNPDGVRVYAGRPPAVPPPTPDRSTRRAEEQAETDPLKRALAAIRPRTRPDTLIEDNARASDTTNNARAALAIYRPVARPALVRTPEEEAAEEPDAPATAQAIATSRRPDARPRNFQRIVARATPQPQAATPARLPPRTVSPRIPSSASVAREATIRNAINLRRVNLIGVFGTPSDRRALVLMPNGRQRKVKVGDALDGGRVSAIGDSELRYQKRGRNLILKMPNG